MNFISVRDLRSQPAKVWKKLDSEKEMVVTSNGRPIAVLSAVDENSVEESLKVIRRTRAILAVETMQQQSRNLGLDRMGLAKINAEIRAVRKGRLR